MACGMCGRRFNPATPQESCGACPLGSCCGMARCPHCGYENPRPIKDFIPALKRVFRRGKDGSPDRR